MSGFAALEVGDQRFHRGERDAGVSAMSLKTRALLGDWRSPAREHGDGQRQVGAAETEMLNIVSSLRSFTFMVPLFETEVLDIETIPRLA